MLDREVLIIFYHMENVVNCDFLKLNFIRCKYTHVSPLTVGTYNVIALLTFLAYNSFKSYCLNKKATLNSYK